MTVWCDFHLHSDRSDGEFPPARVVDLVADAGVGVLALTDHDTTAGHAEASERARARGVKFVGGIEMTTRWRGHEVHVLGLGVAAGDAGLAAANTLAMDVWGCNQHRWVRSLHAEGLDVSPERDFADGPTLLPEMIRRLCERGVDGGDPRRVHARFRTFWGALPAEAFDRLPLPSAAAKIIRSAGGVAILAHPARLHGDGVAEELIGAVDGVEAMYAAYGTPEREALVALAREHGKLYSCGSDYHGYWAGAYANPEFAVPDALGELLGAR